jgi:transposase
MLKLIAEAVQRPTMKFVATKTAGAILFKALHRMRERLVSQRTGSSIRFGSFLLERGIAVLQFCSSGGITAAVPKCTQTK